MWSHTCRCVRVQAFYLARTGRPGPVLIDVPKDVQQQLAVPDWDVPMAISGYMARLPQLPSPLVSPQWLRPAHTLPMSHTISCASTLAPVLHFSPCADDRVCCIQKPQVCVGSLSCQSPPSFLQRCALHLCAAFRLCACFPCGVRRDQCREHRC